MRTNFRLTELMKKSFILDEVYTEPNGQSNH